MNFIQLVKSDFHRCGNGNFFLLHHFRFLLWLRLGQITQNGLLRKICRLRLKMFSEIYGLEICLETKIGKGFYLGHPFNITVNPESVIGDNVNSP